MGRSLGNNLYNLGLSEACKEGLAEMGVDLEEFREREPDTVLGNGGLGRPAVCYQRARSSNPVKRVQLASRCLSSR